MRYTRLEIPCKLLKLKSNIFFRFFIIIPLISIILGSVCVKFLIKPYISKHENKDILNVSVPINKSSSIPNIDNMFFLQAGLFSSLDNANILVDAIKKNGFSPFLVKDKNQYRVVVDFSDDKKVLVEDMDKLKKVGYNTIINNVNFQTINNGSKKDMDVTEEYIRCLNGIIKIQYDTIKQYDLKKNGYKEDLSGVFSESNEKLNKIKVLNSDIQIVKIITDFDAVFTNKKEQYIKNIENKNMIASSENLIEEAMLVADLCKSISQINED